MADQKEITLRQGDATPKDIVLYELPVATVPATTTIYLYQGDATPKDVILRDPTAAPATGQVNYSLTCAAGSYVYTGQSASLTFARNLSLATGTYVYTGQAATLTMAVNLPLAAGAYSYVGNAATLDYVAVEGESVYPGAGYPIRVCKKKPHVRIDDIVERSMRELYEGITETAPQQVKKQAAKIVRPHIVVGVKPATIPPASIIDWATLERDAARVSALLALWQEQMESLEDEEMLLMLMAA